MNLQEAVANFLDRRGVTGKDAAFAKLGGTAHLWSVRRGKVAVVASRVLTKGSVEAMITEALEEVDKLVLVYTEKCTPAAAAILGALPAVELWSEAEMRYNNPFLFGFITDAGIAGHHHNDKENLPKLLPTDPLARHLGAEPGAIVWIKQTWGTLEPEVIHRVVASA